MPKQEIIRPKGLFKLAIFGAISNVILRRFQIARVNYWQLKTHGIARSLHGQFEITMKSQQKSPV